MREVGDAQGTKFRESIADLGGMADEVCQRDKGDYPRL